MTFLGQAQENEAGRDIHPTKGPVCDRRSHIWPGLALLCAGVLAANGCHAGTSPEENSSETARELNELSNAYAAFNRGDIDAAVKTFDPTIEWTEPAQFPGSGTYHGVEAVKSYLRQSRANWAEGSSEPEQMIAAGPRIVVMVHARIRINGSTRWNEVRLADVYLFRKGRVIQMRAFADRSEAMRFAGIDIGSHGAR
jgi:ketosteroid isomerase-like protein